MKIIVKDNFNTRIDLYLSEYFEDISRSKLSKLIKNKKLKVNNSFVKASYIVNKNDLIEINLDDLEIKPICPENLGLEILYQDEDIAIINKPAGIISHPTSTIRSNTVVNFLLYKFKHLSYLNGDERPGIVHRLDMGTSGLMIVALNDESMLRLKDMFQKREIKKKYRAIVNFKFENTEYIIEKNIGRNLFNRKLMAVNNEDGKYAKTSFKVIKQNNEYAFIDINLHTGRTHQIRVHLAYINHPILGDKDYNNNKNNFNIKNQLLQAYSLELNHPISNRKLKIEIPMYPEFKKYYNIIFGGDNEESNFYTKSQQSKNGFN